MAHKIEIDRDGFVVHSFTHTSVKENSEKVAEWINEQKLTAAQIISISMHETSTDHGANQIWVFVNKSNSAEFDTPLTNVKAKFFGKLDDWEDHERNVSAFLNKGSYYVIGLVHSAENAGDAHNQVLFYSEAYGFGPYSVSSIAIEHPNVKDFGPKQLELLNKFIAPH